MMRNLARKLLTVEALRVPVFFRSDSWKMWIPRESEMLSAMAKTSKDPIIGIRGSLFPLRLTMKARLVTIAEVTPKLIFVK